MTGDDIVNYLITLPNVYIHYTDAGGLSSIACEGVVRPDTKGYVYLTQEPMTALEAHTKLFIGATTHEGRGTHIVVLRLDSGLRAEACGHHEVRIRQSLRLDQHLVLYRGENPFR